MMKSTLTLTLLSVLLIVLSGCTNGTNTNSTNSTTANTTSGNTSAPDNAFEEQLKKEMEAAKPKLKSRDKATEVAADDKSGQRDNAMAADKVFIWPVWQDGDCTLASQETPTALIGPQLVIRPDGTGALHSKGRSTDDDDEYHIRFEAKDANGAILFYIPGTIKIFNTEVPWAWKLEMPHDQTWYGFHPGFSYPAAKFSQIATVQGWGGC